MTADPTHHTTDHNPDEEDEHGTHTDTDSTSGQYDATNRTDGEHHRRGARHPSTHDENTPHHPSVTTPEPEQTPFTSQISAESAAYWDPIVEAMEPMTPEAIAEIGAIFRRIDARRARNNGTE